MATEMVAMGAAIVALVAGERLFTRVRPLMYAETAACGASKITLSAGKTPFRLSDYLGTLGGRIGHGGMGIADCTL
jgi:hypothetical protein